MTDFMLIMPIFIIVYIGFVFLPRVIKWEKNKYITNIDEIDTVNVDFAKEEYMSDIIFYKKKKARTIFAFFFIYMMFITLGLGYIISLVIKRIGFFKNTNSGFVIGIVIFIVAIIISYMTAHLLYKYVFFNENRLKYMLSKFSYNSLQELTSWYKNRKSGFKISYLGIILPKLFRSDYFFTKDSLVVVEGSGIDMPFDLKCKDIKTINFSYHYRQPSSIDLTCDGLNNNVLRLWGSHQMYMDIQAGIKERGGDPQIGVIPKNILQKKIQLKKLSMILPIFVFIFLGLFGSRLLPKNYDILPKVRIDNTDLKIGVTKISQFIDDGFDIYIQKSSKIKEDELFNKDINDYFEKYQNDRSINLPKHSQIGSNPYEDTVLLVKNDKIYGILNIVNKTGKEKVLEDCLVAEYDMIFGKNEKYDLNNMDIYLNDIKISDITDEKMKTLYPKLDDSFHDKDYIIWDEKRRIFGGSKVGFSFFISLKLDKKRNIKKLHIFSYAVSYGH